MGLALQLESFSRPVAQYEAVVKSQFKKLVIKAGVNAATCSKYCKILWHSIPGDAHSKYFRPSTHKSQRLSTRQDLPSVNNSSKSSSQYQEDKHIRHHIEATNKTCPICFSLQVARSAGRGTAARAARTFNGLLPRCSILVIYFVCGRTSTLLVTNVVSTTSLSNPT